MVQDDKPVKGVRIETDGSKAIVECTSGFEVPVSSGKLTALCFGCVHMVL